MNDQKTSRREFLKTTAASAGALAIGGLTPASALGANDRINFGVIGCGGMGTGHLRSLVKRGADDNIKVLAVSDVYQRRLTRAKDIRLALEEDGVRRIAGDSGVAVKKSAGNGARKNLKHDGQMLLFDAPRELDPAIRELVQALKAASPHEMTPVQALSLLDELVRKARKI